MDELQREQEHLDRLYRVLGERREHLLAELAGHLRERPGTRQAEVERGATARRLRRLVATHEAAEHGLCFGRLDLAGGQRRYLGRIGLRAHDPTDPDADADPLLIDWRAPAARPFYTATAAVPQGVRLRRHLHTRGRKLLRMDDEVLDGSVPPDRDVELTGEAALLESLRARRTGRMHDVIATLQAEQDRIIRSEHAGVLVVQGGPGTGKTVVALHRAAYLLYTRPGLNERGVLVVGPNPVFLAYISQVLPGLGESSALLATLGELYPGLDARGHEPGEVAELKGRPVMADVVTAAVAARQAAVAAPVEVVVDGDRLVLTPEFLADAADAARGTGRPHNLARPRFRRAVLEELARQLAGVVHGLEDQLEADLARYVDTAAFDRAVASDLAGVFGDAEDEPPGTGRDELEADEFETARRNWLGVLPNDRGVQRLLARLWPRLTPERLLSELFADPRRLALAAPQLSDAERALLHRAAGERWTPADVPLLDEAAELLGHDDSEARRRAEAERQERIEYAQGVLDIAFGSRVQEADDLSAAQTLRATDVIGAEEFSTWQEEADLRTVAERAAADRTWAFGHVIVDEAQELSPMAWRLLLRRCPTRSFTVVGDMAQASEAVAASSWAQALEPAFGDRWRLESLTVNYRTPVEVMAASEPVREAIHPDLPAARAVRDGGDEPWRERAGDLRGRLGRLASEEAARAGDGRVAVLVPQRRLPELAAAVVAAVPEASWGDDPDLERAVVVLTPRQAKGLEFDVVLVADPDGILAGSPRGLNDLFVALTRATKRLGVVHAGPVPDLLAQIGTQRPEPT